MDTADVTRSSTRVLHGRTTTMQEWSSPPPRDRENFVRRFARYVTGGGTCWDSYIHMGARSA
jgi:hypothetical protein